MDSFPAELFSEIFELACTDTGRTGRSLSLVSTYFHDIVKPIQLQSIAIHGIPQMEDFLSLLTSKPASLRKVKHLFVADRLGDLPLTGDTTCQQLYTRKLSCCLNAILKLVSPNLQSLSIYFHFHDFVKFAVEFPGLVPVNLPSLVELTVYGNVSKRSFERSFEAPQLRRLHIANYVNLPDDIPISLKRIAPNLTHLRISGVSAWIPNGNLLDALKSVADPSFTSTSTELQEGRLQVPSVSSSSIQKLPAFPSSLKKVVIGQRISYVTGTRGNPAYRSHTVGVLERLGMMCTDGRLVVLQIPPYLGAPGYWDAARSGRFEETKKDWLERVQGGDGCWVPVKEWVCVAPNIRKASCFRERK